MGARPDAAPDPRFFQRRAALDGPSLAKLTGAAVPEGAAVSVSGAATLDRAGPGDAAFLSDRRYRDRLARSQASYVFVREGDAGAIREGAIPLITPEPAVAWALTAAALHPGRLFDGTEPVHGTAQLEDGVVLSPGAVVGPGARIGRGTVLEPNAVVGPGVCIGRDGRIGAGAVVGFALIGDRVTIGAGAVIGEAGFGVAAGRNGTVAMPQLGRVILQDDVSVGANTCIDRGAFEDTVVGEGTKIDNLCQIAHNVRIGRHCLIAAHTGLSGSVVVGDRAAFGGRAGVVDHMTVGDGAQIAAAAAVLRSVPAGEVWSGYPARPVRQFLRETAWLAKQAAGKKKGGDDHGE
ncbi:UDP-3-O-(3-hydroxymyristoyl)glucosamine N-acyltransferase [Brevundimonas sp. 2R-24]|uniref:UDP-3-O-acylglucosamine N-acyltransferase n=1 Tax=Peiella sedimenti TaxID=3061083 RepID=A0ABT8SN94_9CAUL|nr:UDP-3-O-(3-hydroxymyristoyl)glucosamine N-acyltransferase [Caulobacteraceae bacterium XZ-24]